MMHRRVLGALTLVVALAHAFSANADVDVHDGLARGLVTVPRWVIAAAAAAIALAVAAVLWRRTREPGG